MIADRVLSRIMAQPSQTGNPGASGITVSPGPRLKAAMGLAVLADVLQIAIFPIFVEGAASPADDVVDLAMAGILTWLLGWHWEFLPSFAGKLIPGVDLVPLWSLAVGNVYRKSRRLSHPDPQTLKSAHPANRR
jgi:hypothetical protein